ncbi:MAG: polysulfide reductase NrfD [Thermoleophilia bacterium]
MRREVVTAGSIMLAEARLACDAARPPGVQRQWGWPIAVYLFLAGMGAGAFVIGVAAWGSEAGRALTGAVEVAGVRVAATGLLLMWGPVAAAVGALFLIVDLGRKARFFRAGRNVATSWMARGFFILSAFLVVGALVLAIAALVPTWPERHPALWRALLAAGTAAALGTAVYTGVLLRSMKYVPVWGGPLLPVLFLASALSTGSMAVVLAALPYGLLAGGDGGVPEIVHLLTAWERVFILVEGGVLGAHLLLAARREAEGRAAVHMLVRGKLRLLFWLGIVGLGLVFPSILEALYESLPGAPALLAAAGGILLVGGFLLRLGVLASGWKQTPPLVRLLEARADPRVLRTGL